MESMGSIDQRPEHPRAGIQGRRPGAPRKRARPVPEGWRRQVLTIALAVGALLVGFLVPSMRVLDHQVAERFGQ